MARGTRGRGDGSWSQVGDRWCLQISLGLDASGKRQRPRFYGRTQDECRAQAEEYRHAIRMGLDPDQRGTLVREYLNRWLGQRAIHIRPSTFRRYKQAVAGDINPYVGQYELSDLTRIHVVGMVAKVRAKGSSPRTANHAKMLLGAALQDALRDGLVAQNVARLVQSLPQPRDEIKPLTASDVERLRDATRGKRDEALYALALAYGLRQSELLGLTWADVDFERAILHVRRGLHDAPEGQYLLTELKTAKSRRSMTMPPFVVALFERQRELQEREREAAGIGWQRYWPDLVFRGKTGRPIDGRALTRKFQRLQARLGITPVRRFHDLRHTCATFLLQSGVDMKVIQLILGHANIAITADVYSHVTPELQSAALGLMGALLTR